VKEVVHIALELLVVAFEQATADGVPLHGVWRDPRGGRVGGARSEERSKVAHEVFFLSSSFFLAWKRRLQRLGRGSSWWSEGLCFFFRLSSSLAARGWLGFAL